MKPLAKTDLVHSGQTEVGADTLTLNGRCLATLEMSGLTASVMPVRGHMVTGTTPQDLIQPWDS